MKEIKFGDLQKLDLDEILKNNVFLIFGEIFLYKKVLKSLVNKLLSEDDKELNLESFDSGTNEISEIHEALSTYSFFSEKKVVHLFDSKIFYSKKNDNDLIEKSKESFDKGELRKSAKFLINYLLINSKNLDSSEFLKSKTSPNEWIDEILDFCKDKKLKVLKSDDDKKVIVSIAENMLDNNYFIITTDRVDKRNVVYKAIKERGVIIDCSVSKSERRDDKQKQDQLLRDNAKIQLSKVKKTINNDALSKLISLTGFKLDIFSDNIEKLINYSGDRKRITSEDIDSVLKRTKTDPIFELTGAISEKKINESLFYLKSLLKENFHPLQILTAISNQVRKLILSRAFIDSSYGKSWSSNCTFNVFKDRLMPHIKDFDQKTKDECKRHNEALSQKKESDLLLAKNPKSPYPVYLSLKSASKFSSNVLYKIHHEIAKSDRILKTSGSNPVMVIENILFKICK
jgi:DNA polymerase-3 subunit delta